MDLVETVTKKRKATVAYGTMSQFERKEKERKLIDKPSLHGETMALAEIVSIRFEKR